MNSKLHSLSLLAALAAFATSSTAFAAAAVEKQAKPTNRLVAKAKPQTAVAPLHADEPAPALSEEQMAVAPRVHAGEVPCEFNQKVHITPHPEHPGRFRLQFGKMVYNMTPEPTTTGAVRLEDKKNGVVWLQIPTKSMLMNSKIGQRMVDACVHPAQAAAPVPTTAEAGIGITPGTQATSSR
ncbi:hypothetical protein [Pelomonas sp. SE-A7]|uniref:hypothetical protein n=1 Tax=Pelomonas sp. SE-A7 TaxID=3054953 RepID=UPI00259D188B|nr:hypothetical protein [Pelomonas sp. SE-A7]MDM4764930.1 hypothetical protein [Pelomonas sp. SE-A7]